MRKTTNLDAVKEMATSFLHIEPEPIKSHAALGNLFITHPFFNNSFLYSTEEQRMFNLFEEPELFKRYKKSMEQEIKRQESISSILTFINTPYKLTFFKYINDYLSKEDFASTLIDCYTETEVVFDETNVTRKEIIKWFKKADKNYLMNKDELAVLKGLPDIVTIYRGVRSEDYKYGFSWTLSKSKAEWFATRFERGTPIALKALVNREDILCYTDNRNEREIIIDPEKLDKDKIIENHIVN